jgi:DNA polymerase III delta prime subunit
MAEPLSEKVLAQIGRAEELYHRLVLIAAPSGSGKTAALRDVATRTGAQLLNLNLELSRRMLDLTERQRALHLSRVLEEVVGRDDSLVLLDNIEILFDVALKQDPLRLLQGVSRNRTVVAAWNGTLENQYLTYATPEHPEHRRYPRRELVVVCPEIPA